MWSYRSRPPGDRPAGQENPYRKNVPSCSYTAFSICWATITKDRSAKPGKWPRGKKRCSFFASSITSVSRLLKNTRLMRGSKALPLEPHAFSTIISPRHYFFNSLLEAIFCTFPHCFPLFVASLPLPSIRPSRARHKHPYNQWLKFYLSHGMKNKVFRSHKSGIS